ncbi:MAG: hypothetical protein ACK504_11710 [Bacteroidota bacterium]
MIPYNNDIAIASYYEVVFNGEVAKLLPFGHSRHFPLSFNVKSKQIISGEVNFFNTNFYKEFNANNFLKEDKYEIKKSKKNDSVIILNLLDNCFGHSLLKLFYSVNCFINYNKNNDFIIILPKALEHFLFEINGVNKIVVNAKFSELEKCYILNNAITEISKEYSEVFLKGVETYESYNFNDLTGHLNLLNQNQSEIIKSKVVFYYRSDYWRKWEGNKQKKNIIKLFTFLKPFFNSSVEFCVVGDSDSEIFPDWMRDFRTKSFSPETDFKYNQLFNETLICIGITGSHMLFPSLFSLCTAHLHPIFKYKNMAEDIVVNKSANEALSAYKHLYYYGNQNCSDVSPDKLAVLLVSHFAGLIEKEYKISSLSEDQNTWLKQTYQCFNYKTYIEYKKSLNKRANDKTKWNYYFDKLRIFK